MIDGEILLELYRLTHWHGRDAKRRTPSMYHFTTLDNLRNDKADPVGWDRENNPTGRCIKLRINCRQCWDTNQVALHIDECTTTITRIDRSIRLNGIRQICAALALRDRPVKSTHNTIGYRLRDA